MTKLFPVAVAVVALCSHVQAEDSISPETVQTVKKATVFIRVESDGEKASGSGFVIASDDKAVLVATNDHVVSSKRAGSASGEKPAVITVVFDSGARTERSYPAQIAATDAERDLAVLRVAGVKDPPRPIPYTEPPQLIETMSVYSFGFPFGSALSSTKGSSPAVTIGKASISSLRNGPDGELATVQIDGSLNPGNSGGPIVDVKGRLIGVVVAGIRNSQGIGFAIPSHELASLMRGRIGKVRVTSRKGAGSEVTVRIEAELLDPANQLRAATVHYVLVEPKAKKPEVETLVKHPSSKKVELKIEKGLATAEFTVPSKDGAVLLQVATESGTGKALPPTRIRTFSLAAVDASVLAGAPPEGWKEYRPRDGTFVMWVPEKPEKQNEEERNSTIDGQRMRINNLTGKTLDGLAYQAESVLLPLAVAKIPKKELLEMFRDRVGSELGGKVTEHKEVVSGALSGEECLVEVRGTVTRVRIYASGSRIYAIQVSGTADQVAGAEAEIILGSYRLPKAAEPVVATTPSGGAPAPTRPAPATPFPGAPSFVKPTPAVPSPGRPATGPAARRIARIVGGTGRDKENADRAPEGGYLIGLEIGLGKFGPNDVVRAGRPIYRTGDKETSGEQYGTEVDRVVKVTAKPGYAVGGATIKAGLTVDGMSLTFMKVVDGKLDPKDSYESDWIGGMGGGAPVRLGDGALVTGIIARTNAKDMTGLGLIHAGEKGRATQILGGGLDAEFKEAAPGSGLLVGLEVGLGRWATNDVIGAVQPIFREYGKDVSGQKYGTDFSRAVKVVARPGYAVGAITVKSALLVDGFSITFMKVNGDKLDASDKYESEWIGGMGGGPPTRLGDGTPVIGVVGRANNKEVNGLGLLLK